LEPVVWLSAILLRRCPVLNFFRSIFANVQL
jgi:hypothetical protein